MVSAVQRFHCSFQDPAYFWFRYSSGQPVLKQTYWRDGVLTDCEKNTLKIYGACLYLCDYLSTSRRALSHFMVPFCLSLTCIYNLTELSGLSLNKEIPS